jgi:hypothetical protein
MSIETELKKCAINLQQLTDAIVAQTAAMQVMGQATPIGADIVTTVNIPTVEATMGEAIKPNRVSPEQIITDVKVGEELAADHAAEMATDKPATVTGKVMPGLVMTKDELLSATIVTPAATVETISGNTANVIVNDDIETTVVALHKNDVAPEMTMQEANAALQGINATLGDAGAKIRALFKKHNAITLGQLAPETYGAFVEEARALTGTQA